MGGTKIQPWTPRAAFEQTRALQSDLAAMQRADADYVKAMAAYLPSASAWLAQAQAALAAGQPAPVAPETPVNPLTANNQNPTVLFNGMIAPLAPYALRGAVWYQGESNVAADSSLYYDRLKALASSWRALWGEGDFPFLAVQICPYSGYGKNDYEPLLWEAEERATRDLPNAGLAGTMDIGMLDNIHPSDKQDVGRRLALLAMAKAYGDAAAVSTGPSVASIQEEGPAIRVRFGDVGGGLATRDGQPPSLFEVAGADGKYVPADAVIDGADAVVARSAAVPEPKAVRFAWTNQAVANLMNKEGLPAFPFRSNSDAPPLVGTGPAQP